MNLKQIKTRYATKCAKCKRDIREGWAVFFNPDTKQVFCKPCGELIAKDVFPEQGKSTNVDSDFELILNEVAGNVKLYNGMLASLSDSLVAITEMVTKLDKDVAEIPKLFSQTKVKK